jgi:hypothetical protein
LFCTDFPCFTNVSTPQAPDYRVQTEPRLVIVVAQTFPNNLLAVPITSSEGPWRVPISVASPESQSKPHSLLLIGDREAVSQGTYYYHYHHPE